MKKVFSLTLTLSVLLSISMSAVLPAKKHPLKTAGGNFYVQNGTAWNGTVSGFGAISVSGAPFYPTGQYLIQALNPSSYITVTINCSAPGSHTYGLTGGISPAPTPITTSTGTATFTNIPVTSGDIDAYIH